MFTLLQGFKISEYWWIIGIGAKMVPLVDNRRLYGKIETKYYYRKGIIMTDICIWFGGMFFMIVTAFGMGYIISKIPVR